LQNILEGFGQAAAEVSCEFDGCREFVSIYKTRKDSLLNGAKRFPYFAESSVLYRICRFRVQSEIIEQDTDVSPEDLWDMQSLYVADSELLKNILAMWRVEITMLGCPADCSIPV
jgi:hypothetical protein